MRAKKLKDSILQYALEGKLTSQDSNEEPIENLLRSIEQKKECLVKEKVVRRGKTLNPIYKEDIPFKVPSSWRWVRLGEIINLISGRDLTTKDYNDKSEGIPYLTGASNFDDNSLIINRWTTTPKVISKKNDILITCKGTIGDVLIQDIDEAHIARQIMSVRTLSSINNKFIKYLLIASVNELKKNAKSMIPGISRADLLNIKTPLPPVLEQERIVEKIEELFKIADQYDILYKKLTVLNDKFPSNMEQSILQYAFEGKISQNFLSSNSAIDLLDNIQQQNQKLFQMKKIKKEKELIEIKKDEIPFEIPSNWKWERLGNLVQVKGGKRIPAGSTNSRIKTPYVYLRVTDMKNNTIVENDLRYVDENVYDKIKNYYINKDDLYLTIAGTIGTSGIIPDKFNGALLTENAVKLTDIQINKIYLLYLINSPVVQKQIDQFITRVAQPKLAIKNIKLLMLPIPPLDEQQEIVSIVKSLKLSISRLDQLI